MKTTFALFFLLTFSSISWAQEPMATTDTSQIFEMVEQDAEFPGGYEALSKYISDHYNYKNIGPDYQFKKKTTDRLIVRFVVEKDGSITNIKIEKAGLYCPPCHSEAIRMLESMPKWQPAKNAGQTVRCYVRVSIILSFWWHKFTSSFFYSV